MSKDKSATGKSRYARSHLSPLKEGARVPVKAHVLPVLKAQLKNEAEERTMSVSQLVEYILKHRAVPDISARQNFQGLLKINADIARLGNLFDEALKDPVQMHHHVEMSKLLQELRDLQGVLKTRAREIKL
ncbi:hypothetical protein [Pseudovibrio sp. Tun.PSC04-5.I4]|uniref:hypothetical protein n=1 Tax=Pseudovibrio sp. Tun.PSC04-5.I4 TaxID=1798213 RepID=UPI000886B2A3|nr:hypothetical protein [Pseudovibrio sp. Tun.PSC04-5.I4]SDR48992.1 hypothetical protein SAMN04515695_6101 [Pseudovibrio sp. Tun.PSC04-5.I4]